MDVHGLLFVIALYNSFVTASCGDEEVKTPVNFKFNSNRNYSLLPRKKKSDVTI